MAALAPRRDRAGMTSFGLHFTSWLGADPARPLLDHLCEVGAALDASDVFSSLWLTDHMQHLGPEGVEHPALEPHLVLAAVAARTERVELGVLATSVLYRHPALLTKMITTLDALAPGRAVLGIGAGHPRTESEARSYGFDFPPVGARMAMLEDALAVVRAMTSPSPASGTPACFPRPTAPLRILVAGSGEQRLLRIAAQHADMVNLSFPSGDRLERLPHKLDVLRRHCATVGRDPDDITVTYKALLAVSTSRGDAADTARRWCAARGIGDVSPSDGVFVGEPGEIAEQVRPFVAAGVDHLVVELAGGTDPKSLELAADALAPVLEKQP